MERECAFCGCLMFQARQVACEDCQSQHDVCQTCADEVARGQEGYWLVA